MDFSCLNIAHKSSCFDEEWLMLLRDALSALKVALEKINYLKQYITKKLNSERSLMVCEIKKERVQESPDNYFSPAALAQLYQAECERLARLEESSRKSLSSTRQKQKEKVVNNLSNSSSTNELCSKRRKRKKNSSVKCLKKGKSQSDKDLSSSNEIAIDSRCLDDSVNNSTVDEVLYSQVQQDNLTPKSDFPSKQIPQEHSNLTNLEGGELCGDDENPSIRTVCKDGNHSDPSFSDFSFTESLTSILFDSALKEALYKVTFKIKNNSISDFEIKEALERKGFSNFGVFVRNKQTRTRGFITFKDEETMKAVEACSDLYIHGQPLKIRPCNETLATNDSKSNSYSTPGKIQVKPFQELSEVALDQDCHQNNIPLEPIPQNYEDNCGTSVPSNIDNNNIFIKKEDGFHLTESLTTNETVKSLTLLSAHIEEAITAITEDSNQEQLPQKLSSKKPKKNRENYIKSKKVDPSISSTPQLKTSPTLDHNADITPDVKPILKSSLLEENVVDLSQNDVSSEILSLNVKNSTDVSVGISPNSHDFVSKEISSGSKETCSMNVNQGYNDNNISKGNNPVQEIDESLLINVSCGYPSMRKSFSPGRVRRNSLKSPVPSNCTYESDRESNAASLGGKSFEALSVHSEPNFSVMTQENDCDNFDRYSESNLNFSSKKDLVQEDDQAYAKCFNFVNQCDGIINIIKPFIEPCSAVLDGSINEPYKNKCHEYHIVKKDTLDPKQDYQGMDSCCNVVSGYISADGDIHSSAGNKDAYSSVNNTDAYNTNTYNSTNNTDTFNSANNTDTYNSTNNTDTFNSANNTDTYSSANNTDAFNSFSFNKTDAFNSFNNTDAFNSANNTDTFNSANNTDTYSTSNDYNFDYLNNKAHPGRNNSRKPGDHSSNKPNSSSNFSRKSTHYTRSKSYSNQRYTPYKQNQDNCNRPSRYWHTSNHFNKGNNSSNYHNQPGQFSKRGRRGATSNMGSNRRNYSQNSRNMNHQQRTNFSRKGSF